MAGRVCRSVFDRELGYFVVRSQQSTTKVLGMLPERPLNDESLEETKTVRKAISVIDPAKT